MSLKLEDLTPGQKGAIVLVSLGHDISSKVLKHLNEPEVESLTINVANLNDIPPDIEQQVLKDVYQLLKAKEFINQGGVEYAKKILEQSFGAKKANLIMNRLENSIKTTGFDLLKNVDPKQLRNFIQNELPQTIALILTQLLPQHAAVILSDLPPELQSEVAYRIATMEKISPEALKEIESVLDSYFEASGSVKTVSTSGGTKAVADILNLIETSSEKIILESIESDDPELASEIKNLMFVFEDVILLDDRSIQKVLKEVETKDLSIALKAASEDVKKKIFSNVSERVAVMIQEEMEYMGPVRLSDVESAQQRIVEVIRRLQEEGQVIISGRGGKDEVVV